MILTSLIGRYCHDLNTDYGTSTSVPRYTESHKEARATCWTSDSNRDSDTFSCSATNNGRFRLCYCTLPPSPPSEPSPPSAPPPPAPPGLPPVPPVPLLPHSSYL